MAGVIVCDDDSILLEKFFDDGALEEGTIVVGIGGEELKEGMTEHAMHAEDECFSSRETAWRVPGIYCESVPVADWEG